MNKCHLHIFGVLALLACISCSGSAEPEMADTAVDISHKVRMMSADGETEDAPVGSTFRTMIYQAGSLNFIKSGSYIYEPSLDSRFLAPARLGDDGTFIEADTDMGADGLTAVSDIFLLSPGVGTQSIGELEAIVACPNRTDADGKDSGALYRGTLTSQDLKEYKVRTFEPLHEMRSKISFEIRADEDMTVELAVHDIKVSGAGLGTPDERLLYLPNTRQCTTPDGVENVMAMGTVERADGSDGKAYFKTASRYVLSAIYAPKNIVASTIGIVPSDKNLIDTDYLKMKINFALGDRDGESELILNADAAGELAEFMPRHEYIFKVVVSSTFIKLYLTVRNHLGNDWQEPDDNHEVDMEDETVYLGTFSITGWSDIKYPEQEF